MMGIITHLASIGIGIIIGAASLRFIQIKSRPGPNGFAGSDDFSWAGRPMRIIEATVEDVARQAGA